MDRKKKLYETYEELMKIKEKCSCNLLNELNMFELTYRQIEYIKEMKNYECITTSELADILDLSKPTITQMIQKFIKLECVYKKQCDNDGRVQYIYLTEKGSNIAEYENLAVKKLIDRIFLNIEEKEIDTLINILLKIK